MHDTAILQIGGPRPLTHLDLCYFQPDAQPVHVGPQVAVEALEDEVDLAPVKVIRNDVLQPERSRGDEA